MILCSFIGMKPITSEIYEFAFKPESLFEYLPGQFIDLYLSNDEDIPSAHRHWFTLSSSPTEKYLTITTRVSQDASDYKQKLLDLKAGDEIHISDPMGDFVLPLDTHRPVIFACAGIGITPVRSMLKSVLDRHETRDITILYMTRTAPDRLYLDIINKIDGQKTFFYTASSSQRLTSEVIKQAANKTLFPIVYVSGPEEWVETMVKGLSDEKMNYSLVTDYFPGYSGAL